MRTSTVAVAANAVGAVSAAAVGAASTLLTRSPVDVATPAKIDGNPIAFTYVQDANTPASATRTRDELVLEHLGLVRTIALNVQRGLPVHTNLDDLVQSGVVGLIAAARNYEPDSRVTFGTYARHRIRGAILDSLRQQDPASRDTRKRQKLVQTATSELAAALQRDPTEAEIAGKLGMDVPHFRTFMLQMPVTLRSASSRTPDDEELRAPDFPDTVEAQPDSICATSEMRSLLDSAIQTLPPRHQTMMRLYYTGEMTMKEIGKVLEINESRVSQIRKAALAHMMTALQARGISSIRAFEIPRSQNRV